MFLLSQIPKRGSFCFEKLFAIQNRCQTALKCNEKYSAIFKKTYSCHQKSFDYRFAFTGRSTDDCLYFSFIRTLIFNLRRITKFKTTPVSLSGADGRHVKFGFVCYLISFDIKSYDEMSEDSI